MALTQSRKDEIRKAYESVCASIEEARQQSPARQAVTLVAASKTRSAEEINYAASLGLKIIGENRVQELLSKYDELDPALEIHFIGALQTNKVKYIIDKVSLIHSVDRMDLLREIERQAKKHSKTIDILLEVNLGEIQKSGIAPENLGVLLAAAGEMEHVRVRGLMAVPPISHDFEEQFAVSEKFMKIFVDNQAKFIDNSSMQIASLGMSEDYRAAILAGSNMVRIGSALFGARDYSHPH